MSVEDFEAEPTRRPAAKRWQLLAVAIVAFAAGALLFGPSSGPDGHDHAAGDTTAGDAAEIWTCSMHPQIRQNQPGACPLCGMDLIPLTSSDAGPSSPTTVTLSERAAQLARLETEAVGHSAALQPERRLLGRVEVDETRLRQITTWIGGRIDRLHLATTGATVRRGQTVATLYSPELLAAHQDLLAAIELRRRLADAGPAARASAHDALEAVRERLQLLGLSAERISTLGDQVEPVRNQSVVATAGGIVLERMVTEGTWVEAGAPLYRVADLSRVWVQLDAYEGDLAAISVGAPVQLVGDTIPGRGIEGRVAFIDPVLDPERRTARVRVEAANPDGLLRPGVFVSARLQGPTGSTGESLTVPRSAVLLTGRRAIVYVEVAGSQSPTYEAREVELGPRAGDRYPVLAGLQAGERVVTRGAFALDADLQIRGGASLMSGGHEGVPGIGEEVPGTGDRVPGGGEGELSKAARTAVLEMGMRLQRALAGDDLAGARSAAADLAKAGSALPDLGAAAGNVASSQSLEAARAAFEAVGAGLVKLVKKHGNPLDQPVRIAFCPMATAAGGASWVQAETEVYNPFYGASMLRCGEIRETLAPGSDKHVH
jgi:Cu(I)/Ag(I) efflux system membrane fusion protein